MNHRIVIAQSGGPTAVFNASLAGFIRTARARGAAVCGLEHGLEGARRGDWLDLNALDEPALAALEHTPGAALGSSRRRLDDDELAEALAALRARGAAGLALAGGNGSMWVANRLALLAAALGFELCVIGIPKTIDNDLYGTDHAPGYGSAARFMALAARDAGLDLEAMATFDDVVIFEAFGRDTGWLAAASGLLRDDDDDAPHLIYTPEMAFDTPRFLDDVARIHARLGRVFITAAEGLPVAAADSARDALGRAVYSLTDGVGAALARQVRDRLGLQVRVLRPNTIGRSLSACVSAADRAAAVQAGAAAAAALVEGRSGLMAGLDAAGGVVYVPLETAAGAHRPLPRAFLDADGTAVTAAFRAYALPLIGSVPPVLRLRRAHTLAGRP